jgi:hypothetical protein
MPRDCHFATVLTFGTLEPVVRPDRAAIHAQAERRDRSVSLIGSPKRNQVAMWQNALATRDATHA